jgi:hypothetical protein
MDKDEAHKQEPVRAWFTADEFVEMADRRMKEWAKQADIPDLIAGALGVSRGTAYDLMRDALKEAAPAQEPVAWYRDEDGIRIYYESKVWDDATPLYTAPPAAAVQEGRDWSLLEATQESLREHITEIKRLKEAQPAVPDALTSADIQEHIEYVAGWNECRAAMLEILKAKGNT